MKKVAICGASGLVGSKLFERLQADDWSITVVGRSPQGLRSRFPAASASIDWQAFSETDTTDLAAVVNLAGAGVMDRRWTPAYKRTMTDSRVKSTETCARLVAENPSIRLVTASSVHAYGIYREDHHPFVEGDKPLPGGEACYLHELITSWEEAAQPAVDAGAPVALMRLGVVLHSSGGALEGLLPLFRAFLGGQQGTGRQIMPWISLDDVVAGIVFLLENPKVNGPVNFVSPGACTNTEVMKALGKALGRPSLLPMPSVAARLVMGQAATELILAGQRVEPKKLTDHGFQFRDREVEPCLARLLSAHGERRAQAPP